VLEQVPTQHIPASQYKPAHIPYKHLALDRNRALQDCHSHRRPRAVHPRLGDRSALLPMKTHPIVRFFRVIMVILQNAYAYTHPYP
jgi:hypothetical protein